MGNLNFTDRFADYIIFDLDGVLINSALLTRKAAKLALGEIGIDGNKTDFTPYIGTGEKNFISGPCKALGKEAHIDAATKRFYEIYTESLHELLVYPHTLPLLERLYSMPVKLAIASSSAGEKVLSSLKAAGINPEWFSLILSGDDVADKKPSPQIYLKAMELLGASPKSCLVCEDAISGVVAAKKAGTFCFAITTSFSADELKKAGADHIADDIFELIDFARKEC